MDKEKVEKTIQWLEQNAPQWVMEVLDAHSIEREVLIRDLNDMVVLQNTAIGKATVAINRLRKKLNAFTDINKVSLN